MSFRNRYKRAFTMVELAIVLAIIGLLAAITIPNYMNFSLRAKESAIKENMHTIEIAMEDYAISMGGTYPGPAEEAALRNLLPNGQFPTNPFTKTPTNIMWNADPASQGEVGIFNLPGGGYIIKGYGANNTLSTIMQMGD